MRSPIVEITCTLRAACPSGLLPPKKGKSLVGRVLFESIARGILSKSYQLSLVICGDTLAKRINREYRGKKYLPNVLSFSLGKTEGEIILNIRRAEREARYYRVPLRHRVIHLFAHGCLHLKGFTHGARMETIEKKVLRKFE